MSKDKDLDTPPVQIAIAIRDPTKGQKRTTTLSAAQQRTADIATFIYIVGALACFVYLEKTDVIPHSLDELKKHPETLTGVLAIDFMVFSIVAFAGSCCCWWCILPFRLAFHVFVLNA